ncbi:hypothetical protein [Antrihabitans sp. YC2-6]|uniref:hypothetical protein n=1 Tax=Antrihabitans sp. YC2-6 TaxID=2799498 RepID=UPI0018F79C9F|nr:hypothetical protein [Antrihabitans sp. YC2-6]MBJ8346325.1 hypothetical protein [Antrihabitans sp. YC2-6]
MDLSAGQLHGLNTALSEATCRGITVDDRGGKVSLTLDVLALPGEAEQPTPNPTVVLALAGVARLAASLRSQRWDQIAPTVEKLALEDLSTAVESFGGCHLHGWEFLDLPESSWTQWGHLLSLDTRLSNDEAPHVLEFSQEEGTSPRELDLRIWFTAIEITSPSGDPIALEEFIAGGLRWWTAHDAGDPRTQADHLADDIAPPL